MIYEHEALIKQKEQKKQEELLSIQEKLEQQKQKDLSHKDNEKSLALMM